MYSLCSSYNFWLVTLIAYSYSWDETCERPAEHARGFGIALWRWDLQGYFIGLWWYSGRYYTLLASYLFLLKIESMRFASTLVFWLFNKWIGSRRLMLSFPSYFFNLRFQKVWRMTDDISHAPGCEYLRELSYFRWCGGSWLWDFFDPLHLQYKGNGSSFGRLISFHSVQNALYQDLHALRLISKCILYCLKFQPYWELYSQSRIS